VRRPGAALRGGVLARVVDEDLAHQLRGDAEKVGAALPARPALVDQTQVSLIDERRGLQRVPGPLAAQVAVRQLMQLTLDERQQTVEGIGVACGPGGEQVGHLAGRGRAVAHLGTSAGRSIFPDSTRPTGFLPAFAH
jgi:hypothetical protein